MFILIALREYSGTSVVRCITASCTSRIQSFDSKGTRDWAGYKADKRLTSRFIFSISNKAISYSSKKQLTVALSSTKAEYKGEAVAACKVVWLKRILEDQGVPIQDLILLYCDNLSSIYLDRNPVLHARIKHIEVHYHFIRERIQVGDVDLHHISMNLQVADLHESIRSRQARAIDIERWSHDARIVELEGEYQIVAYQLMKPTRSVKVR